MDKVEKKIDDLTDIVKGFAENVQDQFDNVQSQFDDVNKRFTKIESLMVTKDYLDDKMADLRGDFINVIKKEDEKVDKLTDTLKVKKVINEEEASNITMLTPFSKSL